jgi:sulfate adenylyltransferase subunit 2
LVFRRRDGPGIFIGITKLSQLEWSSPMSNYRLSHLDMLEAESIHILREVGAEFRNPAMLYSVGKDSSVMLRLAEKAFYPGKIPFPMVHIDTTYKFREMIEFRDAICKSLGLNLIVHTNVDAINNGANPFRLGTRMCCALLKTQALLDAMKIHGIDAAIGGARRDEEKSRAKERIFSFRDAFGQWEPKNQRPEMWNLYNSRMEQRQGIRVFPLSNWTELDVWNYIDREQIAVVPLYFAKPRKVVVRGQLIIPLEHNIQLRPDEKPQTVMCRMRSLGCTYCTGAIPSEADTVPKIIQELAKFRRSERENRVIDHDQEGSMEMKKREGYF